jgi:hypothetical protein
VSEGRDPGLPSHKKAPQAAGDAICWLGLGQRGGAFVKSARACSQGPHFDSLAGVNREFLGLTGNETTLRVSSGQIGKTWNR